MKCLQSSVFFDNILPHKICGNHIRCATIASTSEVCSSTFIKKLIRGAQINGRDIVSLLFIIRYALTEKRLLKHSFKTLVVEHRYKKVIKLR